MNSIDLEKLYKVTREEFCADVDAVLDKVKKNKSYSYKERRRTGFAFI